MKLVLSFLFTLVVGFAMSQPQLPNNLPITKSSGWIEYGYVMSDSGWILKPRDTAFIPKYAGTIILRTADTLLYVSTGNYTGKKWQKLSSSSSGGGGALIPAGAISSVPAIGQNFGSNITAAEFIQSAFFQSQPPTASLSGGQNYELHSAGSFTKNISWTAGRQAATTNLASIIVNGVTQTFSNPPPSGSVSGTQQVTVTYNNNATYNMTVTTVDSKTATASTSDAFYPSRYWGNFSGTPNNAAIIAASNELAGGKEKANFSITTTGAQNIFYSYPTSYGALSSIVVGGFESITAFTQTTLSVTNASGYTQNYFIYTSNNTFNNATVTINQVQ